LLCANWKIILKIAPKNKMKLGVDRIYVAQLVTGGRLFMNAVLNFWVP